MVYGLLIGCIIWGLYTFISNIGPHQAQGIARAISSAFIIIPLATLIGLLIRGA